MTQKQKPSTDMVPASAPLPPALTSGWGKSQVDAADVLIPKLLIMQPISEKVVAGEAKGGDIIISTTGRTVGDQKAGVSFIPLSLFKTWIVMEKVGGKFEFRKTEPFTPQNAAAPWEWQERGTTWQRNQCLNCYALLPDDIDKEAAALAQMEKTGEMPDADDALLPVVMSFQRTSFRIGKELATHFAKAEAFGIPAALTTLSLKTRHEKNDKGSFYVFEMEKVGKTPALHLEAAKKWWAIVTQSKVRVDDSDLQQEGVPPPSGPEQF